MTLLVTLWGNCDIAMTLLVTLLRLRVTVRVTLRRYAELV
jgi:hypothetical protein